VSYNSEDSKEFVSFIHTFDKTTRVVGIPKAILYISCAENDDMDVFIILRKLSKTGEPMLALNIPWKGLPVSKISEIPEDKRTELILYAGPTGVLRASLRAID
jgi:uncharacterized protein